MDLERASTRHKRESFSDILTCKILVFMCRQFSGDRVKPMRRHIVSYRYRVNPDLISKQVANVCHLKSPKKHGLDYKNRNARILSSEDTNVSLSCDLPPH